MTRKDAEFAVREGRKTLINVGEQDRFAGLLALRTVACHLGLTALHAELDKEIGELLRNWEVAV
jgi:hypothetical protein